MPNLVISPFLLIVHFVIKPNNSLPQSGPHMMAPAEAVTGMRQFAEKCMKDGKYAEAFFHLTHAIKLCPESAESQHMDLLFLRSKCFLKQQQFYLAMQDALELVDMNPTSTQGYMRKAEVMFSVQCYSEALEAYLKCFQLSASDKEHFHEMAKKCKREMAKEGSLNEQYPFVGAAIGIVVSVCGVTFDALASGANSMIAHPFLKILVVMLVSASCYFVALHYRRFIASSRRRLLEPPIDIGLSEKH